MATKWSLLIVALSITRVSTQVSSQNYDCRSSSSISFPGFFLPFGENEGDNQLPAGDNRGVEVDLNTGFPFFTETHKKLFISTNGIVSFRKPFPTVTPARFPLSGPLANQPLIAPYWADVDTSANNGRVYFRQTTDIVTRQRAAELVLQYGRDYRRNMQSYAPTWVMIVTWRNVTFKGGSCSTPVNTFQLVMHTNGRHAFLSYLYGDITWTTGRTDGGNSVGLGGTPALVGYSSGTNNFYVPNSLTTSIRDIRTMQSNSNVPGIWIFRVETNSVQEFGCNTEGSLTTIDGAGPYLGGKPFVVSGPCLHSFENAKCKIGNITVDGTRLSSGVQCVPPISYMSIEVPVLLSLNNGRTYPFNTTYTYGYLDAKYTVNPVDLESWEDPTHTGTIEWDASVLPSSVVVVEATVILPDATGKIQVEAVKLAEVDTRNNPGRTQLPLGLPLITKMPTLTSFSPLRIYDYYERNMLGKTTIMWTKPQWSLWFFNQYLIELIYRKRTNTQVEMTSEANDVWNNIRQYVQNVEPTREAIAQFMSRGGLDGWKIPFYTTFCDSWASGDYGQSQNVDFSSLIPVPCTQRQAERDFAFTPDPNCRRGKGCYYRPDAAFCVMAKDPSKLGHGQRACYDRRGNLISTGGTVSAGSAQKFFQANWFMNEFFDTRGHAHCCRFTSNCNKYASQRPTATCGGFGKGTTVGPGGTITNRPGATLKLTPKQGLMFGGNQVILELPTSTLVNSQQVKCFFGNNSVPGTIKSANRIKCIAPLSMTLGIVKVTVSTDNGYSRLSNFGFYTYVKRDPYNEVMLVDPQSWEKPSHKGIISWNTTSLGAPFLRAEFQVLLPTQTGSMSQESVILANLDGRRTPGRAELPIGLPLINKMPTLTTYGPLRLYDMYKEHQPDTRVTLWSKPEWSLWFFNQYLIELIYRKRANIRVQMTDEANQIWSGIQQYVQNVQPSREAIARFMDDGGLQTWQSGFFQGFCKVWSDAEAASPPDFSRLTPVPCTATEAASDGNYLLDSNCNPNGACLFRPQAKSCYVSRVPSRNGHGQRACYDTSGNLLKTGGTISAGTAEQYFPTNWFMNDFFDAQGWAHCCRFSSGCSKYSQYRPTGDCSGFSGGGGGGGPGQSTKPPGYLKVVPSIGPALGGNPVVLTTSESFSANSRLVCKFGSTAMPGEAIQNYQVKCIAPLTAMLGPTNITLSVNGGSSYLPQKAVYTYVLDDPAYTMETVDIVSWDKANYEVLVRWRDFNPKYIDVDFTAYMPSLVPTDPPNMLVTPILRRADTSATPGEVKLPIGLDLIREIPQATTFGAIRIYDSSKTEESKRVTLYTKPFWSLWFLNHFLIELTYRKKSNTFLETSVEAEDFWSGMEPYLKTVQPNRKSIADFINKGGLSTFLVDRFTNLYCKGWFEADQASPADFSDLPAVPCTASQANSDKLYIPDPDCNLLSGCPGRGNASQCYLLANESKNKHGQRSCYDFKGELIIPGGTVSAGAAQRYFPKAWFLNLMLDTRGHDHCCSFGDSCWRYAEARPTNSCVGYTLTASDGLVFDPEALIPIVGMLLAGASCGFIMAFLIVCLGLPKRKTKKGKSGNVSKEKPQKPKNQKTKKEKDIKIRKPKNLKRNTVTSYPENDYVEPMYPPLPSQNRNRNNRDSDYRRSDTSATEYTDIPDSYSDQRSSRSSQPSNHQRNSRYSETRFDNSSRNNRKRDSQLSDPASVRSSNSKLSNNSRRSYQQYAQAERIAEEPGDRFEEDEGSNYDDGMSSSRSSYIRNGPPAGATQVMLF